MSAVAMKLEPQSVTTLRPVRRRRVRLWLLGVVPLLVGAVGLAAYLMGGRFVDTDNAYVKADMVPISAEVSGTVQAVLVHENQDVAKGQVLFRLDPARFRIAVAKARANLAQVRTDLVALAASYREKQAEIAVARTRLAFSRKQQRRRADLVAKGFGSAAKMDDAEQAAELAQRQITVLKHDLRRIADSLGGGPDIPVERQPSYRAALAGLEQARLDLAHTVVHAPLAGTVSRVPLPGQRITVGATSMDLVADGAPWVEANFTETDLTFIRPGQPVTVRVDTYPGRVYHGVVQSISPATGAEFSVIPAQNATGNWVKIAQRVPVRIRLQAAPGSPRLRAGLSAEVEVDTGHRRRLPGL